MKVKGVIAHTPRDRAISRHARVRIGLALDACARRAGSEQCTHRARVWCSGRNRVEMCRLVVRRNRERSGARAELIRLKRRRWIRRKNYDVVSRRRVEMKKAHMHIYVYTQKIVHVAEQASTRSAQKIERCKSNWTHRTRTKLHDIIAANGARVDLNVCNCARVCEIRACCRIISQTDVRY